MRIENVLMLASDFSGLTNALVGIIVMGFVAAFVFAAYCQRKNLKDYEDK